MKIGGLLLLVFAIPLFAGQVSLAEEPVSEISDIMPVPAVVARGETLAYDDGNFTGSLGITSTGSPSTPNPDETFGFATYFILSDFGIIQGTRKAGQILIHMGTVNGTDFRLYLWDNIAGQLQPNSHGTHLYSDMVAPLPPPSAWGSFDVSSYNIVIPETTWVGICYNYLNTSPPGADWYLSYCGGIVDQHTFGNLYGTAGQWTTFGAIGYPQYDRAYGVRLVLEEMYAHDVGPVTIDVPDDVYAGTIIVPGTYVKNLGTNTEVDIPVMCTIDPDGYTSADTIASLDPGDSIEVSFDSFTVSNPCTVTVYTQLAADENVSNDTLWKAIGITGIAEHGSVPPVAFMFSAPTISKGTVSILFALPEATTVNLAVYDALGRLRETLASGRFSIGEHSLHADLKLPAGVYFYNLKTDIDKSITKKFLVVK